MTAGPHVGPAAATCSISAAHLNVIHLGPITVYREPGEQFLVAQTALSVRDDLQRRTYSPQDPYPGNRPVQ